MSASLTTESPLASKASTRVRGCRHCGSAVPKQGEEFCCSGCAYVYRLINEAGFSAYYQIKDKVIAPADAAFSPSRDFSWLEQAAHLAEATAGDRTPELYLDIQGISCAGCVWLIERVFNRQPGAGRIEINAQTGQLRISWQKGQFGALLFAHALQSFNYLLGPASAVRSSPPESRAVVKKIGLCAAFAMNVMLFTLPTYFGMEPTFAYARLFGTLSMTLATLSFLVGGSYFLGKAFRALREGGVNIDIPIGLGIIGAYAGSLFGWLFQKEIYVYFDFVSTFILLMLIGRWAQLVAVERNQRRLLAAQPLARSVKSWTPEGVSIDVSPERLVKGQRFLLGPGQMLPVEARLITPGASMDLAWINGESAPRLFHAGQRVPSGATNLTRSETEWESLQVWAESLVAELTRETPRSVHRHRFLERVLSGYIIAILAIAFIAGIAWYVKTGDLLRSGSVVTAILVVSCPCAIGLAFPLTDEIATVALRKQGVFVRSTDLWPRLARVKCVIFDKTGTLTLETPALKNETALTHLSKEEKGALLTLVRDNAHPVARCLCERLLTDGAPELAEGVVTEEVGLGLILHAKKAEWRLGKALWATANREPASGEATVFSCAGITLARFQFEEAVRVNARAELALLKKRNLGVQILSGDSQAKVLNLLSSLGLSPETGKGEMSPHGKATWIREHASVDALMLGDGANDSLAFDQALCRGTPVVHRGVLAEKADFYYLGQSISGVRALFETDDARRRTHQHLLLFSILYNVAAVGLSVVGHMNPLLAAILMPTSSLVTLAIVGVGMRTVWTRV